MNIESVIFNGFQLNDPTFTEGVRWHDFDRMPDSNRSISAITSANRSVATDIRWVQKTASVRIFTLGCPKNVLDAHIGRIRQFLQNKGSLVVNKGVPVLDSGSYKYDQWTTLTYTDAILESVDFDTIGNGSVIDIQFILLDPIAKGGTPQTIASGTHTTDTTIIDLSAIDLQGTFDNQFPVYTFTFNSVTNGASPSISITNGFTDITISNTFTAGDVLVVDTDKLLVTLNTQLIDFSGIFPNIQNTSQPLNITDTLSARNISYTIVTEPRYI